MQNPVPAWPAGQQFPGCPKRLKVGARTGWSPPNARTFQGQATPVVSFNHQTRITAPSIASTAYKVRARAWLVRSGQSFRRIRASQPSSPIKASAITIGTAFIALCMTVDMKGTRCQGQASAARS